MRREMFVELDLNTDSLKGREIIAAQKRKETGQELVNLINENSGLMWMVKIRPDIDTIKVCCEEIIKRNEKGTAQLKMAKAILKMLKKPRSYTRRVTRKQMGRTDRKRR